MNLRSLTDQEINYVNGISIQGCKDHKYNTIQLVHYLVDNNIEGDYCEAGVASGGHIAYIDYVLKNRKIDDRKIHLYDSFCGHSKSDGTDHQEVREKYGVSKSGVEPSKRPISEIAFRYQVESNMRTWNVREKNLVYHEGYFQNLLPKEKESNSLPEKLAFLRIDVNLAISTKYVMEYLYPLVVKGGIIVSDDWTSPACQKHVYDVVGTIPKIYKADESNETVWWIK